ncbi:MAG TPA: hypothetical protein PK509_18270, partial [Catalimonadaceae bacterium]|nr:hypothetical protein [Catalimonadaceae bacterium]
MRQLITFFSLSYFVSWTIWLPLYGHIIGLENLPTLPFHHALGGLGPFIASFITTWMYDKDMGVKQLTSK